MADALRGNRFGIAQIGVLQSLCFGGPTSWKGDDSFARSMQVGASRNNAEGNPDAPAIEIAYPGFWRFRWMVQVGDRSISCYAKQVSNLSPRPALIIKANAALGLAADITKSAPAGIGWVQVPEAQFTATAAGVLWVELHNRVAAQYSPAFFDHISAS